MKPSLRLFCLSVVAAALFQGSFSAQAQAPTTPSSVSYTGGTYNQAFDSLPYTAGADINTGNPITIGPGNSATAATTYTFNDGTYTGNTSYAGVFDFASPVDTSGTPTTTSTGGLGLLTAMAGWYGGATGGTNGATAGTGVKFGAQSGTQTTGGVISFGGTTGTTGAASDSNRSLGVLSTSTSGVSFFGLKLINNTGATISTISFAFTGELWHQQTAANPLNYGYYVDPVTGDSLPTFTLTSAGTTGPATLLNSFTFATGTKSSSTATNISPLVTLPVAVTNQSLGSTPWTPGSALWIVFQQSNSAGGAQGLSIDGFTFSAVPEPGTYALVGLGFAGLVLFTRRRASRA